MEPPPRDEEKEYVYADGVPQLDTECTETDAVLPTLPPVPQEPQPQCFVEVSNASTNLGRFTAHFC